LYVLADVVFSLKVTCETITVGKKGSGSERGGPQTIKKIKTKHWPPRSFFKKDHQKTVLEAHTDNLCQRLKLHFCKHILHTFYIEN
jgi:hypothetical protein